MARTLRRKRELLPSAEIGVKKISFGTEVVTEICGTVVEVIRYIETTAEITAGSRKNLGQGEPYAFKPELI